MDYLKKSFICKYVEDKGVKRVYVSTEEVDRDNEKILRDAWKKRLEEFKKHPILVSSHKYDTLTKQIGIIKDIGVDERGLWIIPEYFDGKGNFEADWGKFLFDQKLAAFSVGFIPYDWKEENGVKVYTDVELVEISQVLVPSLREAIQDNTKEGLLMIKSFIDSNIISKGVVPFEETTKADEERGWDGDGARRRLSEWAGGPDKDKIDWDKYKRGFAWFDTENKENYGAYKLPHHDIIDGRLCVVWRGVVAAMAALLGARGGVDIPSADKEGVYSHLAKHYKQFGKEPPEFRKYTSEELEKMFGDVLEQKEKEDKIDEILSNTRKILEVLDNIVSKMSSDKGINEIPKKEDIKARLLKELKEEVKKRWRI